MVMQRLTAFVLRPRHGWVLVVSLFMVVMLMGCNHRRSALRPV